MAFPERVSETIAQITLRENAERLTNTLGDIGSEIERLVAEQTRVHGEPVQAQIKMYHASQIARNAPEPRRAGEIRVGDSVFIHNRRTTRATNPDDLHATVTEIFLTGTRLGVRQVDITTVSGQHLTVSEFDVVRTNRDDAHGRPDLAGPDLR